MPVIRKQKKSLFSIHKYTVLTAQIKNNKNNLLVEKQLLTIHSPHQRTQVQIIFPSQRIQICFSSLVALPFPINKRAIVINCIYIYILCQSENVVTLLSKASS